MLVDQTTDTMISSLLLLLYSQCRWIQIRLNNTLNIVTLATAGSVKPFAGILLETQSWPQADCVVTRPKHRCFTELPKSWLKLSIQKCIFFITLYWSVHLRWIHTQLRYTNFGWATMTLKRHFLALNRIFCMHGTFK